jgi:hypothetical protein
MKSLVYISITLLFAVFFSSCKRITENKTIILNELTMIRADKTYKCKINEDSTLNVKVFEIEDNRAYGSICSQSTGGYAVMKVGYKINREEKEDVVAFFGCDGDYVPIVSNPNLTYFDPYPNIRVVFVKLYPVSNYSETKPKKLREYRTLIFISKI